MDWVAPSRRTRRLASGGPSSFSDPQTGSSRGVRHRPHPDEVGRSGSGASSSGGAFGGRFRLLRDWVRGRGCNPVPQEMMSPKTPPPEPVEDSRTRRQRITDGVLVALIGTLIREVIDRLSSTPAPRTPRRLRRLGYMPALSGGGGHLSTRGAATCRGPPTETGSGPTRAGRLTGPVRPRDRTPRSPRARHQPTRTSLWSLAALRRSWCACHPALQRSGSSKKRPDCGSPRLTTQQPQRLVVDANPGSAPNRPRPKERSPLRATTAQRPSRPSVGPPSPIGG